MNLDVDRIRSEFPALDEGIAYFDGPGGSQVPRQVADAIARTMTSGISNRGTVTAAERRAEDGGRRRPAGRGRPARLPPRRGGVRALDDPG